MMRAMQLREPRAASESPLREVELPVPSPHDGELLLRVIGCAVCRTDLQISEGDLKARRLPITPGHQIVGRVEVLGAGVRGFAVGDRVGVAWLGGACGTCPRCLEGRENLCERAVFTGWDRDGGFATHVISAAEFTLPLPASFGDLEAAPLLCGGVIGYRSLKVSGIKPGQRLGLFGFGASALLSLQVARHWGCRVFVRTRSREEIDRALAIGAEWAGTYEDPMPTRLDAAITFAPVGSVVVSALKALDRGGTVAINAIHLDGIPAFSYDDLWLERTIRSVANFTREDARELLELAPKIPITTTFDTYRLADVNRALSDLNAGRVSGAAVLDLR